MAAWQREQRSTASSFAGVSILSAGSAACAASGPWHDSQPILPCFAACERGGDLGVALGTGGATGEVQGFC